jgi:hypothetical protein
MPQLIRDFVEHPRSVGENYVEHWQSAMGFSVTMIALALACAVHAFVPGMFKQTASRTIDDLHRRMVTQRHRRSIEPEGAAGRSA